MRAALSAVAVLAVVLGLTSPAEAARPTVSGIVTDYRTGEPIEGIEVCASSERHHLCRTSAADGRYSVAVPKGRYRLTARDPDLYGDWVERPWPGGALVVGSTDRAVNFAMRPGARVHVPLHSTEGSLRDTISVGAFREDSSGRLHEKGFGNVSTDGETGYTQVAKLPPGRYVFQVTTGDDGLHHATSWYPSGGSSKGAQRFTISEGQQLRLDSVAVVPPSRLVVRTQGPKGRPLAPGMVELFDDAGHRMGASHAITKGATTTFHGLAPGRYRVRVTEYERANGYVQWYPSGTRHAQARDIVVGEKQTHTVAVRLRYPTVKNRERPRLRRDTWLVDAGRGSWSPRAYGHTYQWYRDGKRVRGEVYDVYGLGNEDRRRRLKVCVTVQAKGHAKGRACSREMKVPSRF